MMCDTEMQWCAGAAGADRGGGAGGCAGSGCRSQSVCRHGGRAPCCDDDDENNDDGDDNSK